MLWWRWVVDRWGWRGAGDLSSVKGDKQEMRRLWGGRGEDAAPHLVCHCEIRNLLFVFSFFLPLERMPKRNSWK